MATRVSLVYRCRLPGGSKAGLPVFVDLRSTRTGPLADRVGLGRLLTLARVIESPVSVEVADPGDLADPLDQQAVAGLLAPSSSQLVVAGATIRPDVERYPVVDDLKQLGKYSSWYAPAEPSTDDRSKSDLHEMAQAIVVGLEVVPSQVAELLNAIPRWRRRGPVGGFNQRLINNYKIRRNGSPVPDRWPLKSLPVEDLTDPGVAAEALSIYGYFGTMATLKINVPADGAGLLATQYATLERLAHRSGGELSGAPAPELTADDRRILDRVLDFSLDVVQGQFLDRPHPARNLADAHQKARSFRDAGNGDVRAIARELDTAGYLTLSTCGAWSTSSVKSLLESDTPPQRRTDNGGI